MGRTGESLQASEKAQQLSPLAPRFLEHLGWHYLHARQYQPARDALVRAIQLDSTRWRPRAFLALLEQSVGNNVEALATLGSPLQTRPWRTDLQVALGQLYALSGRGEEARAILRNLLDPPSRGSKPWYLIACLQATLGQRTGAFASLDRAVRERSPLVPYLRIDPRVDTLRSDRRFVRLLRQVRLP
jgi:tetratricopeptide (TPR) repeat protein